MRRLFVAINLPKEIKGEIQKIVNLLKPQFNQKNKIRFSPPENWHLTMTFLGYQEEKSFNQILDSLKSTASCFKKPLIEFNKVIFAPPDKPPRMIWIGGAENSENNLALIKTELENQLTKNKIKFNTDYKKFNAHVTLARFEIPKSELARIKLPDIGSLNFYPKTLDLMESHLKRQGAEYAVLSSMDFKKDN